jgi:NADH-quinone oxidoreductase subunit E
MASLAHAQVELGWLSPETMQEVADYIGMPAIAVQEVATFYNMYNLKPVGKHKITVCTNLPCALSGGERAGQRLKDARHRLTAKPPKTASSPWSKASAWAPAATRRSCW